MVARGENLEGGRVREFGMDMYTLLYLKWITNKDLLCGRGSSAQCYAAALTGGEFGGEKIHVYVWLSPFKVHLKLSQHCLLIGYTQIQNKKFFKKKKMFLGNHRLSVIKNCFWERKDFTGRSCSNVMLSQEVWVNLRL